MPRGVGGELQAFSLAPVLGPDTATEMRTALRSMTKSGMMTTAPRNEFTLLIESLAYQSPGPAHAFAVLCAQASLLEMFDGLNPPSTALVGSTDAFLGSVEEVEGGWLIDGCWSFCSGAAVADTFVLRINESPGPKGQLTQCFLVGSDELSDRVDARLLGLRDAGIQRLSISRLIIRRERSVTVPYIWPGHCLADALSRSLAAWSVGVARRMLDLCSEDQAEEPRRAWREHRSPPVELVSALAGACDQASALAEVAATPEPWRALLMRAVAVRAIVEEADGLFMELGGEVLRQGNAIQTLWRDLRTMQKHALLDVWRLTRMAETKRANNG